MEYHVNRDGADLGRFSLETLREAYRQGNLQPGDLVWCAGMSDWVPLESLPELSDPEISEAPPAIVSSGEGGEERTGPAWENPATAGFWARLWGTIAPALSRPSEFYSSMRRKGGMGQPLLFYVIVGWVALTLNSILELPFQVFLESLPASSEYLFPGAGSLFGLAFVVVLAPVLLVVGSFISAAITHVCLMILGGARQPFETTFRVICYGYGAAAPFQIIPVCGALIGGVWGLVLEIVGLSKAHEISTGKAVLAVLLPLLLCCGAGLALAVVIGGLAAYAASV